MITNHHRLILVIGLVLLLGTLALYWPATNNGFVNYDDPNYAGNGHVQAGLRLDGISWAFTTMEAANWHPLTWLSLMVDGQLYGSNPPGFHWTNVLLHAANTLVLFLVWRGMTGTVWSSALVAALFAVHPLHVESVAWVAERKDVLCTFFGLLTLWAYAWYCRRPRLPRYLGVVGLFSLSLLAKPMLVTLPVLLLLLDFWPLGHWVLTGPAQAGVAPSEPASCRCPGVPFRFLALEKLPLLALSVACSAVTWVSQAKKGAINIFPILTRLANALVAYCGYIGKMLWPEHLAAFYPHPKDTLAGWQVAGAGLLLTGLSALAMARLRRRPYLAVGWFWYLGTLVPVIGLVQVGDQAMADRYTYWPLIGLFLVAAWALADAVASWPRLHWLLVPGAVLGVALCAFLTWSQESVWQNSITLWTHALEVTSDNATAHTNLGQALLDTGNLQEAEGHVREALRLDPAIFANYCNLGVILWKQGKHKEAVAWWEKTLRVAPNDLEAHVNLATAFEKHGMYQEALFHLRAILQLDPSNHEAYDDLGRINFQLGNLEEAAINYRHAVDLQPNNALYRSHLALALEKEGKTAEAAAQAREAHRLGLDQP